MLTLFRNQGNPLLTSKNELPERHQKRHTADQKYAIPVNYLQYSS